MSLNIYPLSQSKIKSINKLKQKKYRYNTNSYLCEGWRLFTAASESNPKDIIEIVINDTFKNSDYFSKVVEFFTENEIPIFTCTDRIFKSISDEKSPSGILFVAKLKYYEQSDLSNIKRNNCIYLENISDPGNLGTIIRSAAWFGVNHILLSTDSVDPFNAKVVRATAGGIFNANIYLNTNIDSISDFGKKHKYNFIGTTVENGEQLSKWKVSDKNIIFFGNEANGLTESALKLINKKITVPGSGKMESLNLSVTAGIVLNYLYQESNKLSLIR